MRLLNLCLVSSLFLSNFLTEACPRFCTCVDREMHCDCSSGSGQSPPAFSLSSMGLRLSGTSPIPSHVEIHNCPSVTFHSWEGDVLNSLNISGVTMLMFDANSFVGVQGLHSVLIRDSKIPLLTYDSFGHVSDVHRIQFDNVTIGNIETDAFSTITNISHFRIANSNINVIANHAFNNISRVDHFVIACTSIAELATDAFTMTSVGNLSLVNVTIANWNRRAFSPSSVERAVLRHSHVKALRSDAFAASGVKHLAIVHNRFGSVDQGAFNSLRGIDQFEFANNTLHVTVEGSFDFDLNQATNLSVSGNRFKCDQSICWLIKSTNSGDSMRHKIVQNSVCYGPTNFHSKRLIDVITMADDDDGLCSDGELGSGTTETVDDDEFSPVFHDPTASSTINPARDMESRNVASTTGRDVTPATVVVSSVLCAIYHFLSKA